MLCLWDISGSLDILSFVAETVEALHLRVMKQPPTVLIAKAKTVFSEHVKSWNMEGHLM